MMELQDYTKRGVAPICLDAPCTYTTQRKHFCQTKGVSICPHTFGCPLYVVISPYVWMPSYAWMSLMFGWPLYVWTPPYV